MQPIIMKRYHKYQLDDAIKDNEKRGYEVLQRWEVPRTFDYGARKSTTYCAKMMKVHSNEGVTVGSI